MNFSLTVLFSLRSLQFTIVEISSSMWTGLTLPIFISHEIFYFYWKLKLLAFWFLRRLLKFFYFYMPKNIELFTFLSFRPETFFSTGYDYLFVLFYLTVLALQDSSELRYFSLSSLNFLNVLHLLICKWSSNSKDFYYISLVSYLIFIKEVYFLLLFSN